MSMLMSLRGWLEPMQDRCAGRAAAVPATICSGGTADHEVRRGSHVHAHARVAVLLRFRWSRGLPSVHSLPLMAPIQGGT